jgi:hypothetical protein
MNCGMDGAEEQQQERHPIEIGFMLHWAGDADQLSTRIGTRNSQTIEWQTRQTLESAQLTRQTLGSNF